ncbi:MAG: hypothetical protein E7667_05555 [Ruminococcaceae bacterium]|nr:hypothetical protein [Oscillospiraceae bacterium]
MKRFLTGLNFRIIALALCLLVSIFLISCNRAEDVPEPLETSSQSQPTQDITEKPTEQNTEKPSEDGTEKPIETPCEHEYDNNCDAVCNICSELRDVEHVLVDAWIPGSNSHWKRCELCGYKYEEAEHIYSNACDSDCNVCGEKRVTAEHVFGDYISDSEAHMLECSVCGQTKNTQPHTFEARYIDENTHIISCVVCQYVKETTSHVFNEGYCTCGFASTCIHEGGTASCTSPAVCSKCGYKYGYPSSHTPKSIPGYSATCTQDGMSDGSVCTVCNTVLTEQQIIPAAHTLVIIPAKAPTCTDTGLTAGKSCSACGEVIEAQDIVYALGHDYTQTSYIPPTCTESGATVYTCSICSDSYDIPSLPTGHIESDWLTEASDCESDGMRYKVCRVCSVTLASETVPATGHSWEQGQTVPPSCEERGYTPYTCSSCTKTEQRNYTEPLGHTPIIDEAQAPTCTETGLTEGRHCNVCNKVLAEQTTIPALGHTWTDASCITPKTCSVCGETEGEALGHTIVEIPELQPTCTESGYTLSRSCSACGLQMMPQITLPATGHNYQYSMCTYCKDLIPHQDVPKQVMPRLDINTNGAAIDSKEVYTTASVTLSNCDEEFTFSDISAGIRLRGNSTMVVAKKPYRLKFDVKRNMLGLNNGKKFKSWVLLADYYDSTMLRTFSTFSMAKILNEGKYFSSDFTPVEVYINGTYHGVYLLCEQSQIDGNRVDIYEREDTDTSLEIGYLLIGQGGRTDEPNTVTIGTTLTATDRNGIVNVAGGGNYSISGGDYTPEQIAYVKKYVEGVYEVIRRAVYENAYYSLDRQGNLIEKTNFVGSTTQEKQIETIDAVFNIDACVRLCILDEIVKNLDAGTYNMYVDLSPTGDGRLTLGPPWDFDFALANTGYASTHSPKGYYATNYTYSDGMRVNTTFVFFGNLPWFEDMMRDVWEAHVDELYAVANNLSVMTAMYGEYYQADYAYWNRSLMGHHCYNCQESFTCHADAVDFLSSWLYKRLDWLDYIWGDGEPPEAIEQSPLMKFDFTDESITDYLSGFHNCYGTVTRHGYKVELTEAHDPFFTLNVSLLPETFDAQDYPIIELEYMIPNANSFTAHNIMEIFLCSGNITGATAGISVIDYLVYPDGVYHKVRFDLTDNPLWQGQIHSIRIDPYAACQLGDIMYIKSVHFLTQ